MTGLAIVLHVLEKEPPTVVPVTASLKSYNANLRHLLLSAAPEAVIMGAGLSWLRQFSPNVAAGCIEQGWLKLAGFGRQAIAYPDFAANLLKTGTLDSKKTCLACSQCTTIMRDGGCAGCVPRDKEVYLPIYKKGREGKPPFESDSVAEHL